MHYGFFGIRLSLEYGFLWNTFLARSGLLSRWNTSSLEYDLWNTFSGMLTMVSGLLTLTHAFPRLLEYWADELCRFECGILNAPHYLGGKNFRAALSRGMAKFQGFSPIFFSNIINCIAQDFFIDSLELRRVSQNLIYWVRLVNNLFKIGFRLREKCGYINC